MTTREASRATGISMPTIRTALHDGRLRGSLRDGRWNIDRGNLLEWSSAEWQRSRLLMYPPEWTIGFINFFELL